MKIKLLIFSLLFSVAGWSQTNPTVQSLPYSQNFTSLVATSTVYPSGWQGWTVSTAPGATFKTNAPTADRALVASSTAAINSGNVHNYNGKIGFLNSGSLDLSIVLSINTTGLSNVSVGYDVVTIRNPYDGTANTKISEVTLQYRVGNTGVFTTLTGIEYQNNTTLQTGAVTTPQNSQNKSIVLPAGCENKSEVQLRWIAREVSGVGARPSFAFDNISISGTPPAATTVSLATLSGFSYVESSGPSGEQSFTSSGSNLTADIVYTAPTNYEISLTSGGVFGSSLNLTPTAGTVSAVTIYVRLKSGLTANSYNGETISVTSAGATTKTVTCNGTVVRPTITLAPTTLTGFAYVLGSGPSAEQNFTASGVNLSSDIVLTAPTNYEISLTSGAGFGTSINLTPTGGTVSATTIYVRLIAGLSVNTYNGESITATATNAIDRTVVCDGSVLGGSPVINSALTSSSVYGSAYSYTITATNSPTSYNAVGLPAGLSIDTLTGIISGTPAVGSTSIDITATNGSGSDTKTLVLNITPKNLTISGLTADNKVYDRTLSATLSGTATLVGVVGSDVVTVSGTPSPTFATVTVGNAKPVTVTGFTLSGAQAGNYTVTQPSGFSANITAQPLTVSGAVANNKVYNGTTVATITGATLVGIIAPDVVTITPSGTFATANVGTAIAVTSTSTISGADSSNYSLTQPTGLAADITPASQTITFNALANQFIGAANFNLTATASSGLTVTYVSSNPAVATVSGNTVTVVGIGTTIITASQVGNGNYAAAADVNQNQVVTVVPCLSSNFDSSTSVPAGWSGSSLSDLVAGHLQSAPNCRALAATKDLITSAMDNPTSINFYVDASGAGGQVGTLWYRIGAGSWISVGTFTASLAGATVNFDLSAITAEMNVSFKISSATNTIYIDDLRAFCATTWNGSSWSNGAPTLNTIAVINGNYNTATHGNIDASSLFVNSGFTATITDGMYFNVQNNVTVAAGGTLDVQNNGSLVQINDAGVNTGNIVMHRTTNVKLQDYVYWSSAVAGFGVSNVSPSTTSDGIWKWNPTVVNSNGGEGYWQSGSGNMNVGEGYIVRAPNGYSNSSATPFTANFTGVPNNGVVTPAISRGSDLGAGSNGPNGVLRTATDDNWNLLGNPYPSAIGINAFLTANTEIDGFVRLWTHGTLPNTGASNPYYGNWTSNYTAADYIAVNGAGATSGPGVLSIIGAGQGFFVLMNPGAATTSSVTFNNAMRDKTFSNSQFYRSSNLQNNSQNAAAALENHRIWMDLVSSTGKTTRTLVSYVEGATAGKDRLFDALTDYENTQNFYSLIDNSPMTIQGKSLPFDVSDIVPMGIKVPTNGTYTIAIAAVDGLFKTTSQKIYIEDKLLHTINDITVAPYEFTANQGVVNDRFVLRYSNQTLNTQDFSTIENGVTVYPSINEIKMGSRLENIKDYTVYNVLGQVLATKNKVNANESVVTSILKNNQALIVKVTLENGLVVTKKIIF